MNLLGEIRVLRSVYICLSLIVNNECIIFQSPEKRQPTPTPQQLTERTSGRRRRRRKASIKAIKNGTVTKRAKHFRLSLPQLSSVGIIFGKRQRVGDVETRENFLIVRIWINLLYIFQPEILIVCNVLPV